MPLIRISTTRISGNMSWDIKVAEQASNEIYITVSFLGRYNQRGAFTKLNKALKEAEIDWFENDGKRWTLNLDQLRNGFEDLKKFDFLKGTIKVVPDYDFDGSKKMMSLTTLSCTITETEMFMNQANKIFLSHKSEDKTLVRRFQKALEVIGYEVWLDEKDLKAGDYLDRGILEGFKQSCAAVFFITDNFTDERYLKSEINHAISLKRERDDQFVVITLSLGNSKQIPELLREFVWKRPDSELDALTEIIRALPIKPSNLP